MITVILYGHLAKQFGKRHNLSIKTPAEAVRALSANYKDFKKVLVNSDLYYRVLAGKEDRADDDGLHLKTTEVVKIIPLVNGSGGLGKILLGVALIVVSFYLPGAGLAGLSMSSVAASVGVSLVLSGISQILFSPPKPSKDREKPENKPSYSFNGAVNTTGQGNPIPVAYGRKLRVGSQVISASLSAENLAI